MREIKIWPLSARKEDMMKLVDTVNGMNSADYKERFIAEYQQLVIRYRGLTSMLYKWDRGIDLGFVPTCPRSTYNMQVKAMTDYIAVLEARAVMEELIMALQRFDSLETVIAELKAYDREDGIEELVEYLNDEADYLR